MKIPASLYGLQRTVRSNCSKAVTAIAKGATIAEALKAPDLVDTADHPGLIVLDGPSSLLTGEEHFHCFFPPAMVREALTIGRISKDREGELFRDLLSEPWGMMLLLSRSSFSWLESQERHPIFLSAMLPLVPEFDREGDRYTNGSRSAKSFWQNLTMLHSVLAMEGIPGEEIRAPQSVEGILALIDRALQMIR